MCCPLALAKTGRPCQVPVPPSLLPPFLCFLLWIRVTFIKYNKSMIESIVWVKLILIRVPHWKHLSGYVRSPSGTHPLQSLIVNIIGCGFSLVLEFINCMSTNIVILIQFIPIMCFKSIVILNVSSINEYLFIFSPFLQMNHNLNKWGV